MILQKIRGKNFFSIGNAFLEINIQKYKRVVISGKNGEGKSTLANLITFVLFNKTVKKVTRAQIVNSINNKNCVGEAEFIANNKQYLVRRGIKPNIFEIFEDGVLIDQSAVGDYQTFLEESILKCSYRTFLQTSIISLENYSPFMGMAAAARREFIEDILDIKVFSTMNQLVKSKVTKNKEELRLLEVSMKGIKDRIILQKAHIAQLEEMKQVGIESLDAKLVEYTQEIETVSVVFETAEEITAQITKEKIALREMQKKKTSIATMISGIKQQITTAEKDIAFFATNDNCPTCRQVMGKDHVHEIVSSHTNVNFGLRENIAEFNEELKQFADYEERNTELSIRESNHNSNVSVANSTVTRLNRLVAEVNKEKAKITTSDDIPAQKASMSESAKGALKLRDRQLEITEDQAYNTIMLELFKDSGIKSKIVDQFVPLVNTIVNQYLEKLDFFVSFHLDSEFNETIKSRHRDTFTYNSFSMGQRQRIDLSLLFTFRQIATMRNSFSSNILIMDESLDASIDADGIDLLMNIFNDTEFEKTNIMVISHRNKEVFEETFDGAYQVYMRDGFTQIKE